ncbi:MAG: arsenite methyltransferase [Phycisphaerales bacterium]|jgi:arsenite methyltransferase|nr:arsenite methyltransferase [Phycisphaerales bacterium]
MNANTTPQPATAKSPCACGPSCCTPSTPTTAAPASPTTNPDLLREQVRQGYAHIAQLGSWSAAQAAKPASITPTPAASPASACTPGGGCCGPATFSPNQLASALGYAEHELSGTPAAANMGLSCGNPTAIAALNPGETVVDLGAGGGFDCFIAGRKVGPTGRVIGVDMTPDMLALARTNITHYRAATGYSNVEFRLGEIENLPVADASAEVVISNCVLNLSPDKPRVWREIARVLRPGGRVAVSDLALLRPLPPQVAADLEALVGCVAGAELVDTTRENLAAAGFTDITLTSKPQYIAAMTDWQDPLYQKIIAALPPGHTAQDYITSLDISARKPITSPAPTSSCCC